MLIFIVRYTDVCLLFLWSSLVNSRSRPPVTFKEERSPTFVCVWRTYIYVYPVKTTRSYGNRYCKHKHVFVSDIKKRKIIVHRASRSNGQFMWTSITWPSACREHPSSSLWSLRAVIKVYVVLSISWPETLSCLLFMTSTSLIGAVLTWQRAISRACDG